MYVVKRICTALIYRHFTQEIHDEKNNEKPTLSSRCHKFPRKQRKIFVPAYDHYNWCLHRKQSNQYEKSSDIMQTIPTSYHVGQDEVHISSCFFHPCHQHQILLNSEPLIIVSPKESFISIIQLICHFFLSFIMSSATSSVNLIFTPQTKATNVFTNHSHQKEQLQRSTSLLCNICFLRQRIALIIPHFLKSSKTANKFHSLRNNEYYCSVYNKLELLEYFSFRINIATIPEEFVAVTKIYDEISEEPGNMVALQSEVVVQGFKSCIVQEICSKTIQCKKKQVQYRNPFSTYFNMRRHELYVYKQHKYIVDGIDYMRKTLTIIIYKDLLRSYDIFNIYPINGIKDVVAP